MRDAGSLRARCATYTHANSWRKIRSGMTAPLGAPLGGVRREAFMRKCVILHTLLQRVCFMFSLSFLPHLWCSAFAAHTKCNIPADSPSQTHTPGREGKNAHGVCCLRAIYRSAPDRSLFKVRDEQQAHAPAHKGDSRTLSA